MAGVNKAILIGHLGADPVVRHLEGGNQVATLSLATSESWTNKQGEKKTKTEWHKVEVWGKVAGVCERYLKKGSEVYIEGKIAYETWEDSEGNLKSTTKIKAYNMTMIGPAPSSSSYQPEVQVAEVVDSGTDEEDALPF